jgi:transcriptional regulator with XRE-family HTH domain
MTTDIRQRRKALRLQQQDLARLCSIRPETLSRIERGKDDVPGYVDMILALLERDAEAVRFALQRRGLGSSPPSNQGSSPMT